MRTIRLLPLLALVLAPPLRGAAGEAPPSKIPGYQRPASDVHTGGQPALDDLAWLKAQGVTTIVNMRLPAEHDAAAEEARAKELGLAYVSIPVDRARLEDRPVDELRELLADAGSRPVFLHCSSANRVGGLWMIHRVLDQGASLEEAEAEAKEIGLKTDDLRAFARDYIERHREPEE